MVCDAISFTTASIYTTQEASFTRLNDAEGVVMLIDTDHKPSGGFYIMDTMNNNSIASRLSSNGPLLLRANRDAYMPMTYDKEKMIVQLKTIRRYQSARGNNVIG